MLNDNERVVSLGRLVVVQFSSVYVYQSNLLRWIALGPDYEYPLIQSIHLSLYTVS